MADTLVNIIVDDKPVAVPAGTNLIEAAKRVQTEVAHYCYHPKLPIAGNCRMCLVEVGMPKLTPDKKQELGPDGKPIIQFQPKLAIGCNTPVAEGMVIKTNSQKVVKARQGVMEFLLINHPLDCPICDQAGECRLQEFAVDYGRGVSRFVEEKVHKPKRVPIGNKIMLDVERCIMCSRCERFMNKVAGRDCLGFTKRGSHVELKIYGNEWPNTNYDLNIVDICPVGALTSVDFRFRQRPWFLKETRSVCSGCATGCNTIVWSREGVVYRQTPRDNEAVNQCWMCDYGRLNYKFINDSNRLKQPMVQDRTVEWTEAIAAAGRALKSSSHVAIVASAKLSTEELFLCRVLAEALGSESTDVVPHKAEGDHFLLNADRSPNSNGARLTGVAAEPQGSRLRVIAESIREGSIKSLVVIGEDVTKHGFDEELLNKLDTLVVIDTLPSGTTKHADFLLPGATFAEKRGTFINVKGRLQRFNQAIAPVGQALPEWQILSALLKQIKPDWQAQDFDQVFSAMTERYDVLRGLSWGKIGDGGVVLELETVWKA